MIHWLNEFLELAAPGVLLAARDASGWHPGIGDPSLMGWVTVIAYFAAALLCWRVAFVARGRAGHPREVFLFWLAFAVCLTFLGLNKQLDLQTWFTEAGRKLARSEGWYEQRRLAQLAFAIVIILGGTGAALWLLKLARDCVFEMRLAVLGGAFLVGFIVLRALSFHHFDEVINFRLERVRTNWVLELGGILWIALAAALAWRRLGGNEPSVRPQASEL